MPGDGTGIGIEGEQQVSTTASTTTIAFGRPSGGNPPASTSGRGAGARTDTAFGFCRVTIVAPDSRIDVALPDDVPVAGLFPEVLRLSRQGPAEGAPVGYHLVRRDGTVLDSAHTFATQRILDDEFLAGVRTRVHGDRASSATPPRSPPY